MKTFEEICDDVAKEYGYHDWLTLKDDFCMYYEGYRPFLLKAAERYANYKAEIAWEEGRQSSFWADQYPNTAKTTNPYKQK